MLFLCVVVYLAALYVRPGELFSSLQDVPIVDYLSAVSLFVACITLAVSPRKFWDQPHDKFFLAYFVIAVASNPLNGWMAGGQETFMLFVPVLFCYFLIRAGVRTLAQIRWSVRVLVVLNIFLAANALLPIFAPESASFRAMDTREGVRIQGTGIFNDPNDLGMTLVMALPLVMSTVIGRGIRFLPRVVAAASVAIILTACYYTNSRGTMVGLGVVFSIYAYRRFGLVTASMAAVTALGAIVAFGPSRMENMSAGDASAQGRIQAWVAGYEMLRDSPVWGVGWQRFDDIHYRVAHNSFVHAMAELGLVGAFCFVGMFYWYFAGLKTPSPAPPGPLPAAKIRAAPARPMKAAAVATAAPSATADVKDDRVVERLKRDLADAGIGLLTAMCFLSRQYTVSVFIPLALVACLASAMKSPAPGTQTATGESAIRHSVVLVVLTCTLVVGFFLLARIFVQY